MKRIAVASLAIAIITVFSGLSAATAKNISFPSTDAWTIRQYGKVRIPAKLYKPTGSVPFSAIIALHNCGGEIPPGWIQLFVKWGYVVLAPDSFRPRGTRNECADTFAQYYSGKSPADTRGQDARDAANYLSRLGYIDDQKIGVIGWSRAIFYAMKSDAFNAGQTKIKVGIAIHPACPTGTFLRENFIAPILILTGELDDWNPPQRCKTLVDNRGSTDVPMELVIYKGARHRFDTPRKGSYVYRKKSFERGHRLEYNSAAHKDSTKRTRDFLFTHLVRPE
jgi:dienelactone hydrolase